MIVRELYFANDVDHRADFKGRAKAFMFRQMEIERRRIVFKLKRSAQMNARAVFHNETVDSENGQGIHSVGIAFTMRMVSTLTVVTRCKRSMTLSL